MTTLLALPGDGIGPENPEATLVILRAAADVQIEQMDIGEASLASCGSTLPDRVRAAVPDFDGVILGPVSHYTYPAGQPNPSATLRKTFDLYANIPRSGRGTSAAPWTPWPSPMR